MAELDVSQRTFTPAFWDRAAVFKKRLGLFDLAAVSPPFHGILVVMDGNTERPAPPLLDLVLAFPVFSESCELLGDKRTANKTLLAIAARCVFDVIF
jgi:hypothetical protein